MTSVEHDGQHDEEQVEEYEGFAMPKINVYLPDDLAEAVKEAGVPVSAVCQRALEQAVRRVTAVRETAVTDLRGADLATRLTQFTARARDVLNLGIEQARAAGEPVGTGHILSGLLTEGRNMGLQVLRSMEIEPSRIGRELAQRALGEGAAGPDRFTGPAAKALESAVSEATAFGHNYVGCEHLLLGLVVEPDGIAGQELRSLGADPRLTRRAVAAAVAGYYHLHSQVAPAGDTAAVVRQEMQALVQRIERLEARLS
jgi:ATP-dependent Clp protease ATP-binding subunit ClpA